MAELSVLYMVRHKYWIAGSDRGAEGEFRWCYPDRLDGFQDPPLIEWGSEEPDNYRDQENCLDIETRYSRLAMYDIYCNHNRSYICEVSLF